MIREITWIIRALLKIAAICVAALERHDYAGRHYDSGTQLDLSRRRWVPEVFTHAVEEAFLQLKSAGLLPSGLRIVLQTTDEEWHVRPGDRIEEPTEDPHDLWSLLQLRALHDPTLHAAVTEAGTLGRHQAALKACLVLSKRVQNLHAENVRLLRNQPARIEVQGQEMTGP